MTKFPVDASKSKVIKAFKILGFQFVCEREHIAMIRTNPVSQEKCENCKKILATKLK